MELLTACVQFNKVKWVQRSVYETAMARSDATDEAVVWTEQHDGAQAPGQLKSKDGVDEFLRRSSAVEWFISYHNIVDDIMES